MSFVAARNPTPARRVLVVGATGFLGSALVRRFVARGERVAALGRGDGSSPRLSDVRARLSWFQIERDGLAAALADGADVVIYTAANFGRSGERHEEVLQVNTALPLRVLSEAVAAGCPLFVYADTALRNVANAYSLSKRQFAEWGELFAAEARVRFLDLRLEHMYGPGDDESKFPAFVIGTLLRNEPEIRLTLGEQRRDFVFIDDVVSACEALVDNTERLPTGYGEYSIGSGRSVRIREFVELVQSLTGSESASQLWGFVLPAARGDGVRGPPQRHDRRRLAAADHVGGRSAQDDRNGEAAVQVLITGGCGFVGANIAAVAIERGDSVTLFDNLSRVGASENLDWLRSSAPVSYVNGDVRSADEVASVVRASQPDAVFHLAGQVAMTTSLEQPVYDFEVNALGTLNILEAVRTHAPAALVAYASTNKVYGDLDSFDYHPVASRYICDARPLGFDEATALDLRTPYGCSKGAADQYVLEYHRAFGLRTVVFRHSSMYGERQFASFNQGWIGWFCQKAVEASRRQATGIVKISGDGKQVRDALHADDVARLYVAAADNPDAVAGHAFNIGGGPDNSLSLLELFHELAEYMGRPFEVESGPFRKSDQRVFVADIRKVDRVLGWRPRVGIHEGLRRALSWAEQLDDGAAQARTAG